MFVIEIAIALAVIAIATWFVKCWVKAELAGFDEAIDRAFDNEPGDNTQ